MPYNKYYKQKKQVSYDEGETWEDATPAEYQKGALYEEDSPDCRPTPEPIYRWVNMDATTDYICKYIQPTGTKFQATYSDGRTYSIECVDDTVLSTGDTRPSGYETSAMTSAVIGDCVTNIGRYAFDDCYSLTSVTIGNNVRIIDNYAFYDCSGLTSITIPDSVDFIGTRAFLNCSGLTSVAIGSGIGLIGVYAFRYCTSLTSIAINRTAPPTLKETAFADTNNCPIYVPASSVNAYKTASVWSNYADRIQPLY